MLFENLFRNGFLSVLLGVIIAVIMIIIGFKLAKNEDYPDRRKVGVGLIILSLVIVPGIIKISFSDIKYSQGINFEPLTSLNIESDIKSINNIVKASNKLENCEITTADGIVVQSNYKRRDNIKERVDGHYAGCIIIFTLYDSGADAIESYDFERGRINNRYGLQEAFKQNDWNCFYSYLIRARSDPEGGSALMGYYTSYVELQNKNLEISILQTTETKDSKNIDETIGIISEVLSGI